MFYRKANDVVKGCRGYNNFRAADGFAEPNQKKEQPIYKYFINIKLNFGKYKGVLVKTILNKDPKYMLWLIENSNCTIDRYIINELKTKGLIKDYDNNLKKVIK